MYIIQQKQYFILQEFTHDLRLNFFLFISYVEHINDAFVMQSTYKWDIKQCLQNAGLNVLFSEGMVRFMFIGKKTLHCFSYTNFKKENNTCYDIMKTLYEFKSGLFLYVINLSHIVAHLVKQPILQEECS